MTEKPSINDYDWKDFTCVEEFEYWRKNAIAQLEAENERLRFLLKGGHTVVNMGGTLSDQWLIEVKEAIEGE